MGTIPDEQLLREFVDRGSEEAFSELVRRHVRLVYGAALRQLGNVDQAQEVTQAVFLILSQKAGRLGGKVVLAGWLYQTTRFAVANARRTELRRRRMEESMAKMDEVVEGQSGQGDLWREQVEPLVDEALGHLGESDRTALILHFLEDKPLREVGQVLGSSEDAAQKRVSRALDKLRGLLKRKGVVVSAGGLAAVLQGCASQAAPASLAGSISWVACSASAAPASVLTFTQQTWTLMAWTKTKSLILTAVAALALAGGVGTGYWWKQKHAALPPGAMVGAWEGKLTVPGQVDLRLITRFQSQPDGSYKATLDSVDQGVANVPIQRVEVQGRQVKIALPALNATYVGTVGRDGSTWEGEWIQINFKSPLRFEKTDKPSTIASIGSDVKLERRRDFDAQGRWEGTLRVAGVALRLLFKIQEASPGNFVGTIDSIDQGVRNMGLTSIKAAGSNVVFEVGSIGGRFEGTIDREASEIEGDWTQGGKTFALDLKRAKAESSASGSPGASKASPVPAKIAGSWLGVLNIKDVKLRLRMKMEGGQGNAWIVKLDSIDQGGHDIPSTMASYEEEELRVEWKGLGAIFTAHLDGEDLVGQWKQGPVVFPLTMQREGEK